MMPARPSSGDHSKPRRLRRLPSRFLRAQRGVAAIEFAMILPVMLSLYFGVVEVAQGVMIDRKVTELSRALADLTASSKGTIADADMSNIFDAASTIMMPFTSVAPKMVVSSVVVDGNGNGKVCWSQTRNGIALGRGSTVTLPASVKVPGTSVIMATSSYRFTPTVGYIITGPITIGANDPIYMRPRNGQASGTQTIEQVQRAGFNPCPNY